MKAAELIKFSVATMKALSKVGIRMDDCDLIDIWDDYQKLIGKSFKKTYVVALLAARHKLSERTIMRIIKRFEQNV